TSKEGNSSISSQARERRKLLGGHCECLEKQAFGIIINDLAKEKSLKPGEGESPQAWRRRKPSSQEKAKALKPGEGESPQAWRRRKPSSLVKEKGESPSEGESSQAVTANV
ncbi:hypothetical protein PHAVU_002G312008, partial [Phaseolus vulgaris]